MYRINLYTNIIHCGYIVILVEKISHLYLPFQALSPLFQLESVTLYMYYLYYTIYVYVYIFTTIVCTI